MILIRFRDEGPVAQEEIAKKIEAFLYGDLGTGAVRVEIEAKFVPVEKATWEREVD